MKKLPIRKTLRSVLGTVLPAAAILVVGSLLLTGAYALLPSHTDDYREYSIDPTAAQEQNLDLTLYPWNELTVPYEGPSDPEELRNLLSDVGIPYHFALNLDEAEYLTNRSRTVLGIRNIRYLPYDPYLDGQVQGDVIIEPAHTEYILSVAIRSDGGEARICSLRAQQDGGRNEPSEAAVRQGYEQLCELAEHPLDAEGSVFSSFALWLSRYTDARLINTVYELLYKGMYSHFLYRNEVYFRYVEDGLTVTLILDAASGVLTGFSLEWQ